MTLPDAIRAAQADPGVAIRRVGSTDQPLGMWIRGFRGDWIYTSDSLEMRFTVDEILADWETVPVAELERAR